jgi:hypothetical protein
MEVMQVAINIGYTPNSNDFLGAVEVGFMFCHREPTRDFRLRSAVSCRR